MTDNIKRRRKTTRRSTTRRSTSRSSNSFDKILVNYLDYKGSPASTLRISRKTMMAWPTAREHLSGLKKKGLVNGKRKGNKIIWWT